MISTKLLYVLNIRTQQSLISLSADRTSDTLAMGLLIADAMVPLRCTSYQLADKCQIYD